MPVLRYAVVCLFIAVLLGLFGASGGPARSDGVAGMLSLVFLLLAASIWVIGWRRGRRAR